MADKQKPIEGAIGGNNMDTPVTGAAGNNVERVDGGRTDKQLEVQDVNGRVIGTIPSTQQENRASSPVRDIAILDTAYLLEDAAEARSQLLRLQIADNNHDGIFNYEDKIEGTIRTLQLAEPKFKDLPAEQQKALATVLAQEEFRKVPELYREAAFIPAAKDDSYQRRSISLDETAKKLQADLKRSYPEEFVAAEGKIKTEGLNPTDLTIAIATEMLTTGAAKIVRE